MQRLSNKQNSRNINKNLFFPMSLFLFSILFLPAGVSAQNTRPTPTPTGDSPAVISRDTDSKRTRTDDDANEVGDNSIGLPRQNTSSTAKKEGDRSTKQKKMLLFLDLLTRTEQREASLQKQLFDMFEKQNSLNSRLHKLEYQSRPEVIRSAMALTGSLRPEDLREQRKKVIELEKASIVTLLTRVDARITKLEANVLKAEALVEKIRLRFDKIMDEALVEEDLNF